VFVTGRGALLRVRQIEKNGVEPPFVSRFVPDPVTLAAFGCL